MYRYVGKIAAYSCPQAVSQPSRLAWSEGRRPPGAGLHSSDEPGELSQWLNHDNSTINIVIRYYYDYYYYYYNNECASSSQQVYNPILYFALA